MSASCCRSMVTRAAASAATVGVPGPRGVRGSSIEVERTSCAGQRRTRLAESLIITSFRTMAKLAPAIA